MDFIRQKKFVFVLMPFHNDFNDIYKFGIKRVCNDLGTYCERVDEQIFTESILDRILNQISKADILIADMTGRNPNVFYEVGYAHALGKRVILLTQDDEDIPFDFRHFPHIIYRKSIQNLSEHLNKKLVYFLNEPTTQDPDLLFRYNIEVFFDGKKITQDSSIAFSERQVNNWEYKPKFDIFNNSDRIYRNKICIGIEGPSEIGKILEGFKDIKLPNERILLLSQEVSTFYPKGWKQVEFGLMKITIPEEGFSFAAILKNFSPHETIEIPVNVILEKEKLLDMFF